MGCIQSSIATVYSIYSKFCNETTLHGLKHTVAENFNELSRFLWFVLTVCAFTGAGYCALNQLGRYNSEPVVVSLQRDYRGWTTAFPALTACLLERVEQDKARAAIFRIWNITEEEDPEKYQYYYEFVELVAEISFRGNIQNFWKYQGDDSVDNIDLTALAREVHPPFELQVETSQRNLEVRWVQVMTEEGLCQTFNSAYAQYQVTDDHAWQEEPLMTCHYHSENCYVKINSMSNAMRYFIHSPYEISTAISNPTGEIYPGDELSTDFKVVEIEAASRIKGLSPAQRRCHYPDEWLAKSIKAYSFSLCQMQCRTHMAVMFCGCRPYFHIKGDGDICDARGMACIGRNVEILVNLPKNLAKCSCMPQCDELNYYSHTKKVNVRNLTTYRTTRTMFVTTFSLACNSVYYVTSFLYGFIWILHIVLPFVIDIGIFGVIVYHWTRLRKPNHNNVIHIFGPEPGSKESELHPQKTVRCIAHRGAGLDAPENTLQAFKYCVENECGFVELDVRLSRDGQLVLLHDQGLERLSGTDVANIRTVDWETIKNIDVGATHPNRLQFKEVRLCLLDDAIEYLLSKEVRMIIDVKGESQQMVNEILTVFASRPVLYKYAVVTTFNPFILYQIRRRDPKIVGAISYRPYCFSAQNYDAENGPTNPRFGDRLPLQMAARGADVAHALLWRWSARWCAASAVLVHKDIVSPSEVSYWRSLGVRCAGWCVNRPLEKLYWRGVLRAPYLANTLIGEPEVEQKKYTKNGERNESERILSTGEK
ncbi:uncharacterized protein LOC121725488 [Aricia agestis]|uniref:uncharacterized protein LOC121725488 n=1 Tax=Aricia agestis TaxID=91739 RepID=UPI001C20A312|nr:uncharacterized protein LOC121725488 [Aricia agestis]